MVTIIRAGCQQPRTARGVSTRSTEPAAPLHPPRCYHSSGWQWCCNDYNKCLHAFYESFLRVLYWHAHSQCLVSHSSLVAPPHAKNWCVSSLSRLTKALSIYFLSFVHPQSWAGTKHQESTFPNLVAEKVKETEKWFSTLSVRCL